MVLGTGFSELRFENVKQREARERREAEEARQRAEAEREAELRASAGPAEREILERIDDEETRIANVSAELEEGRERLRALAADPGASVGSMEGLQRSLDGREGQIRRARERIEHLEAGIPAARAEDRMPELRRLEDAQRTAAGWTHEALRRFERAVAELADARHELADRLREAHEARTAAVQLYEAHREHLPRGPNLAPIVRSRDATIDELARVARTAQQDHGHYARRLGYPAPDEK